VKIDKKIDLKNLENINGVWVKNFFSREKWSGSKNKRSYKEYMDNIKN